MSALCGASQPTACTVQEASLLLQISSVRFKPAVPNVLQVGVKSTGTYGAGLLRHLQAAGIEVLEFSSPDKQDRRSRENDDDLNVENAAHAAFAGKRIVTPKTRDGMIASLKIITDLSVMNGITKALPASSKRR